MSSLLAAATLNHHVLCMLPSISIILPHADFCCTTIFCLYCHAVLLAPHFAGDAESQKLILATGRISDESPLLPGYPVEFANALDIASDGTVYFSCSTDVLAYK
jgi:hypothetical protein